MKDHHLRVTINAKFDWLNPPTSKEEEILRVHADVMANAKAKELELAVQLIISQMLKDSDPSPGEPRKGKE